MTKIFFVPKYRQYKNIFPEPVSIQSSIPDWWKKQETYFENNQTPQGGNMLLTIKKCQAIFDAMTFGYYLKTPMDIYIDSTGDKLIFDIPGAAKEFQQMLLSNHLKEQISQYPVPEYYHKDIVRIHPMWLIKTEPGYSSLFLSPIHNNDCILKAIPGVIDTDTYPSDGFLSFFVPKNFKGIIKQGTPFVQIIPFKREEWDSSIYNDRNSDFEIASNQLQVRSVFQNGYRIKKWFKKTFR